MNIEIRWTAVYCDCLINWQKQLGCISLSRYVAFESFNLKLWFEINLHRLRMDFSLSDSVHRQINREWRDRKNERKDRKGLEWLKWQTANTSSPSSILHAQTRCRYVHARGFTTRPPGCGAFGLSRVVSRWAAGPLDRLECGRFKHDCKLV